MDRLRQFYIDGAWVDPVDGTAFEVIHAQSRSNNGCCGGAIGIDDQPTQVPAVTFSKWTLM